MIRFRKAVSVLCVLCLFAALSCGCSLFEKNVADYNMDIEFYFGTLNGTFTGLLKSNKPEGEGTFVYKAENKEGWKYEGSWIDGHMQGPGKLYLDSGKIQEGVFDYDYMVSGTVYDVDGSVYEGELRDGVIHGKGVLTLKDGTKYDGEFKDGKYNGAGSLYWNNGAIYIGDFVDNKYHGQGTFIFPDGEKYVGEFENDLMEGEGVIYYPSGKKMYEGTVKDGKCHGEGIYYNPNGTVMHKGIFSNGSFIRSTN